MATFELIIGTAVFDTTAHRDQAYTFLGQYTTRGGFRGEAAEFAKIDTNKYGGPAINVLARFVLRADADACMADIKANSTNLRPFTSIVQTTVDNDTGTNVSVDSLVL